jgi:hypothetical protein
MATAAVEERPAEPQVRFGLQEARARYVRLECTKYKESPVTDFPFVGETEVFEEL